MEAKTRVIVITVILVIILFIVIVFKLKSDKKRKSSAIPYNATIKPKEKKTFLSTTPSAVLALLTFFGALFLLLGIGEGVGGEIGDGLAYILSDLVIAVCCFFIIKQNPRSIWYVPIICNLTGIISAIVESNFWVSSMWIYVCIGWVLSIIASIIGAQVGRRRIISENP
jgi:predicted secreted protein